MAAMQPNRISGIIINDVGPELEPKGIQRIASYVGKTTQVNSWTDAVAITKAINQSAFPNFTDEEWEDFARNIFKDDNGKLSLDYDPDIAIPFKDMDTRSATSDLWPQFEAIVSIPMLLIRGANSDLISTACVEKMFKRKPDLKFVEVPETGHAPTLNEPLSRVAINSFLNEL
jgi:pimeloyl-ACP methyl ester carboxylesterase